MRPVIMMAMAVLVVLAACFTLLAGSLDADARASQLRSEQPIPRMVTKGGTEKEKEEKRQEAEKLNTLKEERAKKSDRLGTITTRPHSKYLSTYQGVTKNEIITSHIFTSAYQESFNDPQWPHQWYAQDYRVDDSPVVSLNLMPLYLDGITGRGVTVAVVDQPFDDSNKDITPNYSADLSYDVCDMRGGVQLETSSHGTNSAGVIAMAANNTYCGVGIAFQAQVASITHACRNGESNDYMAARAAIHKLQSFDIYSNSWGPDDTGYHMLPITPLRDRAMRKGIKEGRGGKGTIYVWAAGNGGEKGDNCAADELVNHIANIAITCASQGGKIIPYTEYCSAIYATTFSANTNGKDEMIVAPDLNGMMSGCVTWYRGTSAATPLAAGIFALLLQANSQLTYRDVRHLIALGSEVAPLADNGDIWYRNAMGFWVSLWFGFGLLNAENMYLLSKQWKSLPAKHTCMLSFSSGLPRDITFMKTEVIALNVNACKGTTNEVLYLEEVEVSMIVKYPYRGALHIDLVSPSGTRTTILPPRTKDKNTDGLVEGNIFKSLHTWGEDPRGSWQLEVTPKMLPGGWRRAYRSSGMVQMIWLTLHGTKEKPFYYDKLAPPPRKYWGFRLPDGRSSEDPNPPVTRLDRQ